MKKLIAIFLCALLAFSSSAALADSPLGQTMPDFTVTTTTGETLALSQLLESRDLVVLNIFATWCPPCRMESPDMEAVYRDYSDRMEIVAVSGDPDDTLDMLSAYKDELGLTFTMGQGTGIFDFVEVMHFPTTLFIHKSGTIVYFQEMSFQEESQFRELVERVLDANYDGTPVAGFNVYVCDENMEGVPGAVIQFCDTDCQRYTTDEDGMICFYGKPARYNLSIESVPDGYRAPDYEGVCDGSGEWVIIEIASSGE